MKLQEIFEQLAYGELSQIRIGQNDEGEVDETGYPTLVAHINLGLTTLYKRFPLKEGRLTLQLFLNRVTYPLTLAYAESNAASGEIKHILDAAEPFQDDILKVERVYTLDMSELGLNDESNLNSVFTPSAQILRVPTEITSIHEELLVVYRANHPILKLVGGYIDPLVTEVELPYSHLEALLYFVASRTHNPIGMVNEFHAGNSWAAKFEQECQKLEQYNLRVDQGTQWNRLNANGWL